ncbi:MAG TPA: iron ABC transporter permease [Parvularcula sp.]|nr:iron ABC transporter permease [Parvularcula sp.]HBS31385.1 iron ABC transporter permease [Parvularcula sp.]HBS36179.1 iron ABC transporter permease [Parvularcula sp.]
MKRAAPRPVAFLAAAVALFASAPLIAVLASLARPFGDAIRHVAATTGAAYVFGTLQLMIAAGIFATLIGSGAALAVSLAEFPGRRIFSFALATPLAVPAYIAAYAYGDFFGPFGAFAAMTGAGADVKSAPGAVFVLTMTLYPYVYLAARAAFAARSGAYLEAARLAGVSPLRAAIGLLAPAARPAIAGGALLVMMEAAADFGVADYFGVPTLSVGVFRTWNAFGDLTAAAQLASLLVLIAIILVTLETFSRRGGADDGTRGQRARARLRLGPAAASGAVFLCAAPVLLGAVIPIGVIAGKLGGAAAIRGLGEALANSVVAASAGAALIMAAAMVIAYAARASKNAVLGAALRIATLGYSVPGAVIAIGVFSAGAFVLGGAVAGATGLTALLYAYLARFLTAGLNVVSGGLEGVAKAADAAARMLGAGGARLALRIHAPLMAPSLVAAAIILFVDIAKELPATLILRSFNFETLATRVYRLAGDERLAEAAPAALALITLGLVPAIALSALARRR